MVESVKRGLYMSDGKQKNEKGLIHRSLAILSWPLRLLIRLYRSVLRQGKIQVRRLHRTIMDRRFWRVWFRRIKQVGLVTVKWIAFVIAFCIWPIGLLVLLYELVVCLFPSLADVLSPSLADLFPSLKDLFDRKADPDADLFSRVRVNMVILTAWVGVFFLVWRTRIADKQTQINQESHYTDLFTKAIEQLGATRQDGEPALEIRIGAIYALERLAKDSERDYGPIIETLAAYIREHCRNPKTFDEEGLSGDELNQAQQKWEEVLSALKEEDLGEKFDYARYEWIKPLLCNPPADRTDVAAALTVLSRRERNRNWTSTGEDETQPDFTGANFQGATLWNKSEGLAREGTNLRLAHLEGADLREANLEGAKLMGAKLSGANLIAAKFKGANLSDAKLVGANFINSKIVNVNLIGADLKGANLMWADVREDTILKVAKLESAKFVGAVFYNVNLEGANLRDANLRSVDLSTTNLSGALLVKADLQDARNLTTEMIENAFGDQNTSLPNGVTPPENWGSEQEAIEKWQASWEKQGWTVPL